MADRMAFQYLGKVKNCLGYQVITMDGGVFMSSGDLENGDRFAADAAKFVQSAANLKTNDPTRSLSVYYTAHYYTFCISHGHIVVVKKQIIK